MIFLLAWRNIWRNRIRSLIIIASVTVGLVAGIFIAGLYKGMIRARVRTVIYQEVAHLQVHHPQFKNDYEPVWVVPAPSALTNYLQQRPEVKALALRSVTNGMLATGSGSAGVTINGVESAREDTVSGFQAKITEGDALPAGKENAIVVSRKLAGKMKLKTGSKVVLTFTDKDNSIVTAAFRITGIYATQNSPLDERNVFVHRSTLSSLLNTGSDFHELAVLLHDDDLTEPLKRQLMNRFPRLTIESWSQLSPETAYMVNYVNVYSYIMLAIIMIALGFGIVNTMLMAILERSRETAMLLALGMSKVRLFSMVTLETLLLTLSGVPVSLLVSWQLIGYLEKRGINVSAFAGEAMSSFGLNSIIYPEYPYRELPSIGAIVLLTALLSSMFPSLKSMQLSPARSLK